MIIIINIITIIFITVITVIPDLHCAAGLAQYVTTTREKEICYLLHKAVQRW